MRTAILKAPKPWWKKAGVLPVLADDGNTVSHLYASAAAAIVDTKSVGWSTVGTVPVTPGSKAAPPSIGPFSDANYLNLAGTGGNDALDFAGDFYLVIAFLTSTASTFWVPIGDGTAATDGWYVQATNSGPIQISVATAGSTVSVGSVGGVLTNSVNVLCVGRTGTTAVLQLNDGAYRSSAAVTITPATTTPARIGRYSGTGQGMSAGSICELYVSSATPTAGIFTAALSAFKAAYGISAW